MTASLPFRTGKFRVLSGYHCQPVYPPEYREEVVHGVDRQGNAITQTIKVPISRMWFGLVVDNQGQVLREGEIVESRVDLVKRHNRGAGSQKYERVPDSTPAHPGHPVAAENPKDYDDMPIYDDFRPVQPDQRPMTDDEIARAYEEMVRRKTRASGSGPEPLGGAESTSTVGVPAVSAPSNPGVEFHDSSVLATLREMSLGELRKWCAQEEIFLPPALTTREDILRHIEPIITPMVAPHIVAHGGP